jgi:hypothetical protein
MKMDDSDIIYDQRKDQGQGHQLPPSDLYNILGGLSED